MTQTNKNTDFKNKRIQQIKLYNDFKSLIDKLTDSKYKQDIQNVGKLIYYTQVQINNHHLPFIFTIFCDHRKDNSQPKSFYLDTLLLIISSLIKAQRSINDKTVKYILNICAALQQCIMNDKLKKFFQIQRSFYSQQKMNSNKLQKITNSLSLIKKQLSESYKSNENKLKINERMSKFIQLSKQITNSIFSHYYSNQQTLSKQTLFKYIHQIHKYHPQNIFQQIFLNRLKQISQEVYNRSHQTQLLNFCCSFFIPHNLSFVNKQQTLHHEHKNYHWPINLATIIKHVKKTIVGFLNLEGGIIYIGMKQNPKQTICSGIQLSKQQVLQFFKWIRNICDSIYPQSEEQNKKQSHSTFIKQLQLLKNKSLLQNQYQYLVNEYMSIQFVNIIDQSTYLDYYQQNNDIYKKSYLIRIKIKPGTNAHTYHLLRDDKNGQIQSFFRKDSSVNKLSSQEFFELYQKRIDKFMDQKITQNQIINKCPFIHFNFNFKSQTN